MKNCYFLIICKLVVLFYSPLVLADRLTLEEMPKAIEDYNKEASKEKKITSARSYNQFQDQISGAPSWPTLYREHVEVFGTGERLSKYLFGNCESTMTSLNE
ncbi:MAG: hypothetical protein OXK80_05635 [Bdellovibrionales bacterium]|nr:hypothetical protein [Bdellovibrionales bacterium]